MEEIIKRIEKIEEDIKMLIENSKERGQSNER